MATTRELIKTIFEPMEAAGYKMPLMGEDREKMVALYKRILGGYSADSLEGAMTAVLQTCTFTPKPADFIRVLKDIAPDEGDHIWVERGTPEFNAWVTHKYHEWGQKQRRLLVPTPFPPEEDAKKTAKDKKK